jgi:hypothetical protein
MEATYPFEYLLAFVALGTWLKLLLKLRVTRLFGPMFKMLINMTVDLAQFLILWIVELVMFACVALMIFSQLPKFNSFTDIVIMYFEASLGSWNLNYYLGKTNDGLPNENLYMIGVIFHCIFLLVNMVLFLNFVIAILSSTFAFYENKRLGLYYEVIVGLFPSMEYDERYGSIVCATSPFNLMIAPFQWITLFPLNDKVLLWFNNF